MSTPHFLVEAERLRSARDGCHRLACDVCALRMIAATHPTSARSQEVAEEIEAILKRMRHTVRTGRYPVEWLS